MPTQHHPFDWLLPLLGPDTGTEGGGAGDGGTGDDPPGGTPAGGGAAAQLTMTQAEFDARVQKRLGEERARLTRKYGGEPDELRQRLDTAEKEAAQLKRQAASDSERAVLDAKAEAKAEAERAYQQRVETSERIARAASIRAAIAVGHAATFKPDLVGLAIDQVAQHPAVTYDPATGAVTGIDEAVQAITATMPSLLASGQPPQPPGTPAPSNGAPQPRGGTPGTGVAPKQQASSYITKTYPGPRQRGEASQ